jgi:hypothetical protein
MLGEIIATGVIVEARHAASPVPRAKAACMNK